MKFDKKFSFHELTSNANGKTSASGVAGLFVILIGGLSFFIGALTYILSDPDATILTESVFLTGIGASLLGVRKVQNRANPIKEETVQPVKEEIITKEG